MSIRIVPITISFFLVFGHVFALGAELPLMKRIVMPSNMEALNVENEAAPLYPFYLLFREKLGATG